jgi:hypothetical protein
MNEGIIAILVLAGLILALVLAVCWIALPFYVIGTNKRLDKIIKIMEGQGRGHGGLEDIGEGLSLDRRSHSAKN